MLVDITQGLQIASRPLVAEKWLPRARGMIGRRFEDFDAMIFPRCASIHTFFMTQRLDVIFLDAQKRFLASHQAVRPWRFLFGPRHSSVVIELPVGALCGIQIQLLDLFSW
jgi:uncharacterized protein